MSDLLFPSASWTFQELQQADGEIRRIAEEELRLDYYPNQYEIISSDQMLDAYSSVGLPLMYSHWSFGRKRAISARKYYKGATGLAYELVINSNPCISYLMETNTSVLQALVMAHAGYGHNSFFKGNYQFKEGVDAGFILDYLAYAKKYIKDCEEKYGLAAVESTLDAAHSVMEYGVDRFRRPSPLTKEETEERSRLRREEAHRQVGKVWETIPEGASALKKKEKTFPETPEENILLFIEENSPNLESWKREIIRIVRRISQYLEPQRHSQIMNEGWATFTHYHIMTRLHEKGLLSDGQFLEFIRSHSGVVATPRGPDLGINPYALGLAMFQDLKRICLNPREEDKKRFDFAGDPDWVKPLQWAAYNFKDDSFVLQFLTDKVITDLRMFSLEDDPDKDYVEITHVALRADEIRKRLSRQIQDNNRVHDLRVYNVDRWGTRKLTLALYDDLVPVEEETSKVLRYLEYLWGYPVVLLGHGSYLMDSD